MGSDVELAASVERFVDRHIEPGDGELYTWDAYHGYRMSTAGHWQVPKGEFRWHLEQAMPDGVERDGDVFSGVEYAFP